MPDFTTASCPFENNAPATPSPAPNPAPIRTFTAAGNSSDQRAGRRATTDENDIAFRSGPARHLAFVIGVYVVARNFGQVAIDGARDSVGNRKDTKWTPIVPALLCVTRD